VRQWIGSILFTTFLFVSVPIYGSFVFVLGVLLSRRRIYPFVVAWVDAQLWALRALCGLDYVVEGREHLPRENTIVLMKHSSAWETLAQLRIFPDQTWVLKRELMWVPVFGWVLAFLKPIAINRKGGTAAVQQVVEQGRARLDEGLWVVIFPEGTRVPAGQTRRYGLSGALLASQVGRPVVPVAHNAGEFWPRRGLRKRRGVIRVVIGPPIPTAGRDPRAINEDAQRWIEETLERLRGAQTRDDASKRALDVEVRSR